MSLFVLFLDIRALASKLVEQWLKTVKGEQVVPVHLSEIPKIISDAHNLINDTIKTEISENIAENKINIENQIQTDIKNETAEIKDEKESSGDKEEDSDKKNTLPVLKISLKDGKKVVSQIDDSDNKSQEGSETDGKEHHKSKSKDKSRERSSSSKSSSSSKHSSKSHSSSSDRHKSSNKSSSSSSSSSSRRSSKDGTKDKDKQSSRSKTDSKSKKSSDRGSLSSSKSKDERSKSSSDKDKYREKEKDEKNEKHKDSSSQKTNDKSTDEKPQSPSIHKLGKIPKLSDVKKEKPSISIEVRKPDEPKPKTVKTFHSRFRKHGLEEEVKPPPSRAALQNKKPPPVLPPSVPMAKRPSPVHNETPPEKKPKIIESVEKPGAIKLIPPKPKREYKSSWNIFYYYLTYFIFSGLHSGPLPFASSSVHNSLGRFYFSGKSKMCNTIGSKVIFPLVKYLSLINSQFCNAIFPLYFS